MKNFPRHLFTTCNKFLIVRTHTCGCVHAYIRTTITILRLKRRRITFSYHLFRQDSYVARCTRYKPSVIFRICLRAVITRFKKRTHTCPSNVRLPVHVRGKRKRHGKRRQAIFYSVVERTRVISRRCGRTGLCGFFHSNFSK